MKKNIEHRIIERYAKKSKVYQTENVRQLIDGVCAVAGYDFFVQNSQSL